MKSNIVEGLHEVRTEFQKARFRISANERKASYVKEKQKLQASENFLKKVKVNCKKKIFGLDKSVLRNLHRGSRIDVFDSNVHPENNRY